MNGITEGMSMGISLDVSRLSADAKKAEERINQMTRQFTQSGEMIDRAFSKAYGSIFTVLGVSGLSSFVQKIAGVRGEFQQLEVAYSTLLGSQEKANALMKESVELAAKTPFDLQGVARGAKQLLAYNFEAEKIPDILRRLGDVAAGLSLPLERLVYLYGTTAVQGRVFARDMMQFQASGIPVAQQLADIYGVTASKINEMVSQGKIGFPQIEEAFMAMTSSGGKFNNLMEAQSKTITGLIANLSDAVDVLFNELGQSSEGVIAKGIEGATYLVENYKEVAKTIGEIVVAYGSYRAAVIAINAVMQQHRLQLALAGASQKSLTLAQTIWVTVTKSATTATRALNAAMKANPVLLIAGGFGVLVGVITRVVRKVNELSAAEKALQESTKQFNEELARETREANSLFAALKKTNPESQTFLDIRKQIVSKYGAYLKGLVDEKGNILDINAAIVAVNKGLREQIALKVKNQAVDSISTEALDKQLKTVDKIMKKVGRQVEGETLLATIRETLNSIISEFTAKGGEDYEELKRVLLGKLQQTFNIDAYKGEFNISKLVNTLVEDLRKSDKSLREVEQRYAGMIAVLTDTSAVSEPTEKTVFELISEQRKKLAQANLELKALVSGESKTTKDADEYTKLIADKKKEIADLEASIATLTNTSKDAKKAMESYNEIVDSSFEDYTKMVESSRRTRLQRELEGIENDYAAKRELQKKLIDLDLQEQIKSIDKAEKEARERAKKARQAFDNTYYEKQREEARKAAEEEMKYYDQVVIKSILDSTKDRDAQRLELERAYLNQIAVLREANEKGMYDAAIARLEELKTAALAKFDSETNAGTSILGILFGTSIDEDAAKLREVVGEAKVLIDFIKEGWDFNKDEDNELAEKLGLTKESYEKIKSTPADLDAIISRIEELEEAADNLAVGWEKLTNGFDKVKKSFSEGGKQSDLVEGLSEIQTQLQSIIHLTGDLSSSFRSLGAEGLADTLDIVTEIASATMRGAEAGAAFGPTGAVVGATLGLISSTLKLSSEAQERHKKALEEVEFRRLEASRAYTLELLKQNDLLEEQKSIFGEDSMGMALTYVKQFQESLEEYSATLKGALPVFSAFERLIDPSKVKTTMAAYAKGFGALSQIEIVTGHKKTGLFGWGKGKDVYSSVLDVYPDLIDNENKLNVERAKAILANEKMSDSNKALLESLIDLSEAQEDVMESLKSYLAETFGGIGQGLIDSIRVAVKEGKDGIQELEKSISKTLENLGEQLVYSLFFSQHLNRLEEDILNLYSSGLSEQEVADRSMALLASFYRNIESDLDKATNFLEQWKEQAKDYGFELFKESLDREDTKASYGEVTKITQEQASSIDNRLTGIHMTLIAIENQGGVLTSTIFESSSNMRLLAEKTTSIGLDVSEIKDIGFKSLRLIEKIEFNTRELPIIRQKLERIEVNTRNL